MNLRRVSPSRGGGRGFALATLLMVVFLLLVFGLTLADLTTSAYQLSYQASEQTRALEVAQAGANEAIDKLTTDPTWSAPFSDVIDTTGNVSVTLLNNLQGATPRSGVPAYTAQIDTVSVVASGRTVHLQLLVQYSSFPYAVAGWAGVQTGAMTVLGASDLTSLLNGQTNTQGNVYSGGPGPSSLTSGAGTSITGRARSVGGVQIASPSTVTQGIDRDVSPEAMPSLDITTFNTIYKPDVQTYIPNNVYVAPVLTGPVYVGGDATFVNPVLLDTQLYVDGNLTLTNATGTGSIFTTGNCNIQGLGVLLSTTGIAVFTGGDLSVNGPLFQGVLFCQGNLAIGPGVTIVGAALAGQQVLSSGSFQVTYLPEYTQFGGNWSQHNMQGSLVNGQTPLLKVLFWKEVS